MKKSGTLIITLITALVASLCLSVFAAAAEKGSSAGITFGGGSDPSMVTVTFYVNDNTGRVADTRNIPVGKSLAESGQAMPTYDRGADFDLLGWTFEPGGGVDFLIDTPVSVNQAVYAQWARVYNVRFVNWNGALLDSQRVRSGGSAIAPANPYRAGYTFIGWDRSFTYITGDTTVTAQYRWNSGGGGDGDDGDDGTGDGGGGTGDGGGGTGGGGGGTGDGGGGTGDGGGGTGDGGGGTGDDGGGIGDGGDGTIDDGDADGSTITPEPAAGSETATSSGTAEQAATLSDDESVAITESQPPLDSVERWVADGSVPRIGIGENGMLLFAPLGAGAWAFLNMIFAIIGVVFAAATAIRAVLQKKRGQDGQDENDAGEDQPQDKDKQRRQMWLIIAIVMGIAGAFLFLLTQDMGKTMVLVNLWTIGNVAILALEILAIVFTFKRGEKGDDNNTPGNSHNNRTSQEIAGTV